MNRIAVKTVYLLTIVFMVASLLIGVGFFHITAHAGPLTSRSVQLSDSQPSHTASYAVTLTPTTAGMLGSIKAEFCDNTPLFTETCLPPPGFDIAGATLSSQSGETGFVIDPSTTANELVLSRSPVATTGSVPTTFRLDNVHNTSNSGTQYARYTTYITSDASGASTDKGGLAYVINPLLSVSTEVPPYLEMCVGTTIVSVDCSQAEGDYLNLGNFSTSAVKSGLSQLMIATNAENGYSVAVGGSSLTSGNNVIPPIAVPTPSAPGTNQFGINLRANTDPASGENPTGVGAGTPTPDYNQPNRYVYRSGDVIATNNQAEDYRKYTTTYIVNISNTQPAGVYASTFIYTGLGNF